MADKIYTIDDIQVHDIRTLRGFIDHLCARPRMYVGNPLGDDNDAGIYETVMLWLDGFDAGVGFLNGAGSRHRASLIYGEDFAEFVAEHLGITEVRNNYWRVEISACAKDRGVKPLDLFCEIYCAYLDARTPPLMLLAEQADG